MGKRERISKYTKKLGQDYIGVSNINYYLKSGFWLSAKQAVSILLSLVVSVLYARFLSKELFGQFGVIISLVGVVSIFALPGLNVALTKASAQGKDGSLMKAVKASFLYSLIGTPVLMAIGCYYFAKQSSVLGISLMVIAVIFPLVYGTSGWQAFLHGKKRFDLLAQWGWLQSVLNAAWMAFVVISYSENLVVISGSYFLRQAIFNCLFLLKTKKEVSNSKQDSSVVPYGKYLTRLYLLGAMANRVDSVLIAVMLGFEQVAIYRIATLVGSRIKDLIKSLYKIVFPKISTIKKPKEVMKVKLLLKAFVLAVLATVAIILVIPPVMNLLFSSKYSESVYLAQLLVLVFPFWILNSFLLPVLENSMNKKVLLLFNTIPYLVKLLVMTLFFVIPKLDVLIFSQISFSLTSFLILLYFVKKEMILQQFRK